MTAAERCMLLLCSTLGDESARPLSVARFRDLGRMARAFGSGGADPLRELGEQDLVRLGCRGEEASRVLALLSRERQLDAFLLRAERAGVHPLTRLDPAYPVRLRGVLGEACPPILFWKGNPALLQQTCISVVGSRELRPDNRTFAETAGRLIAESGFCLCSGGAKGADRTAADACLRAGGRTLIFPAVSLLTLDPGENTLYLCEDDYDAQFSAQRALSRNRLIHAMGEKTLVAQTSFEIGGTWQGTEENLRRGYSPVFIYDDGTPGTAALCERGAVPVRELHSLALLEADQLFFG